MRKALVFCIICFIPSVVFAAKIGVLHLKSVGVEPETAEIVANLLAAELSNYKYQVANPDVMDAVAGKKLTCYESDCAAEVGFTAKVEQVAFGSVSRLGEKHIVQISIVSVSTRDIIWSGSLSAKRAEDLDMAAKRLAKSIAEGRKVEETVEVGLILEEEAKKPLRRKVFHTAGIKAGMLLPIGGYGESSTMYHLGVLYWYETSNLVAELAAYSTFSGQLADPEGNATETCVPELSILYMLSRRDISSYVGGGIGFGILSLNPEAGFDPEAAYGFTLNGGGGIVFFRTYDIRVLLDLRYRVNMAQVENFDGPHHGLMFSIGFTYTPKPTGCLRGGCLGGCW